jgi:osmotically-inducible protein OsmY
MKADQDVKADVEDELQWDPDVDDKDIAVAVRDGTVQLSGYTSSYGDKFEAEVAAKRVVGVAGIANDIEVRIANLDQRPDPDIARDAVDAIARMLPDDAKDIRLTVRNGQLALEGSVEWYSQKERAESAVRWLRGVKGVTNSIQIKPSLKPGDLKGKIQSAFLRNAMIDASRITVETSGGTVTLKGSVKTWSEREAAEHVAWGAPGVFWVDDRISIAA